MPGPGGSLADLAIISTPSPGHDPPLPHLSTSFLSATLKIHTTNAGEAPAIHPFSTETCADGPYATPSISAGPQVNRTCSQLNKYRWQVKI